MGVVPGTKSMGKSVSRLEVDLEDRQETHLGIPSLLVHPPISLHRYERQLHELGTLYNLFEATI